MGGVPMTAPNPIPVELDDEATRPEALGKLLRLTRLAPEPPPQAARSKGKVRLDKCFTTFMIPPDL
jgi:hypothetical protein